jgi:propanediol dehydratase small subunit
VHETTTLEVYERLADREPDPSPWEELLARADELREAAGVERLHSKVRAV